MFLFETGTNISELFEKNHNLINAKLEEYDYRQLKEFSDEDVENISKLGCVEQVIIDFDNPFYSTQLGKMQVYNMYRFSPHDKEYITVDSIDVIVKILIPQGDDITKYSTNCRTVFISSNDTSMDIIREPNGYHYLTFKMQFQHSEMARMEAKEQSERVKKSYNEHIYCAKSRYATVQKEINEFNASLYEYTKKQIKIKINKDSVLDMFSQAIGVDITPKNEREKGEKILITPKKESLDLPEKHKYEGYYIDKSNYQVILNTIREHLIATEILPKPVQKLADEELIRDTILWALNANYIVATGESFRAAGKTDICVNFKDKSAFIAECKVWHKASTFTDALNQVYSYATWRDCKIAILIFNLNNKDFGQLLKKVEESIKSNDHYVSAVSKAENEWECKFKSKADSNSNITVNVLVADYYLRKE